MKNPIGFVVNGAPNKAEMEIPIPPAPVPVKSLVQVYFPERNQTLTYFNDRFDLKRGDFVFVDGKLEGIRGIVREVSKNFKIAIAPILLMLVLFIFIPALNAGTVGIMVPVSVLFTIATSRILYKRGVL